MLKKQTKRTMGNMQTNPRTHGFFDRAANRNPNTCGAGGILVLK
jgi:hypothetical protein